MTRIVHCAEVTPNRTEEGAKVSETVKMLAPAPLPGGAEATTVVLLLTDKKDFGTYRQGDDYAVEITPYQRPIANKRDDVEVVPTKKK